MIFTTNLTPRNKIMNTSVLETPIAYVKNARATATHRMTLADAADAILGGKDGAQVAGIRQAIAQGRTDEAGRMKKMLPAYLFAGEFDRRRADALVRHSGLMVLDFDGVDNVDERKREIATDPHAVLCFVSPSGTGLKLVIRVEPDAAVHGESFDTARAYFLDRYGMDADPSGRDLARLCFTSHDPTAIIREDARVLHRPLRTIQTIKDCLSNGGEDPSRTTPDPQDTNTSLRSLCNTSDIITATQPTQPGQRHRKIFDLARGLRFECQLAAATMPELKAIVRTWHETALPRIGTQDFTETWSDFVHAWTRVTTPLSTSAVTIAWQAVQSGDIPPQAASYDHPAVQKLVALCWHLGRDGGTFYLAMATAAGLLHVKSMQVCRWLKMLQADGVLSLVKPGTRTTAAYYRWMEL